MQKSPEIPKPPKGFFLITPLIWLSLEFNLNATVFLEILFSVNLDPAILVG